MPEMLDAGSARPRVLRDLWQSIPRVQFPAARARRAMLSGRQTFGPSGLAAYAAGRSARNVARARRIRSPPSGRSGTASNALMPQPRSRRSFSRSFRQQTVVRNTETFRWRSLARSANFRSASPARTSRPKAYWQGELATGHIVLVASAQPPLGVAAVGGFPGMTWRQRYSDLWFGGGP